MHHQARVDLAQASPARRRTRKAAAALALLRRSGRALRRPALAGSAQTALPLPAGEHPRGKNYALPRAWTMPGTGWAFDKGRVGLFSVLILNISQGLLSPPPTHLDLPISQPIDFYPVTAQHS